MGGIGEVVDGWSLCVLKESFDLERKEDVPGKTILLSGSERSESDFLPGVLLNEPAALRLENPKALNCFRSLGVSGNDFADCL